MDNNNITEVEVIETKNELVTIVETSGLEQTKGQKLLQMFTPYFNKMAEIEVKINLLNTETPSKEDLKIAREIRLALKNNRVASEKAKDDSKAMILIEGRLIDNLNNIIKNTSKGLEIKCETIEKYHELQEQKRKDELKAVRTELLSAYEVDTTSYVLENMTDESFNDLLELIKRRHEEKIAEAARLEAERIAKEKAEAEERERIRVENEKLKAEAAERERQIQEERNKAEAEIKSLEEKAAKEREAAEKERLRIEKEQQAKLDAERKQREKAEAELKRKKEEIERIEKEKVAQIEAENKARLAAEKKAKLAPDKDKLRTLYSALTTIEMPDVKSEEAKKIVSDVRALLVKVCDHITELAKNM